MINQNNAHLMGAQTAAERSAPINQGMLSQPTIERMKVAAPQFEAPAGKPLVRIILGGGCVQEVLTSAPCQVEVWDYSLPVGCDHKFKDSAGMAYKKPSFKQSLLMRKDGRWQEAP